MSTGRSTMQAHTNAANLANGIAIQDPEWKYFEVYEYPDIVPLNFFGFTQYHEGNQYSMLFNVGRRRPVGWAGVCVIGVVMVAPLGGSTSRVGLRSVEVGADVDIYVGHNL